MNLKKIKRTKTWYLCKRNNNIIKNETESGTGYGTEDSLTMCKTYSDRIRFPKLPLRETGHTCVEVQSTIMGVIQSTNDE